MGDGVVVVVVVKGGRTQRARKGRTGMSVEGAMQ